MRILIISQIFLPEMGALSNRLYPFVRSFADAGHKVTVATGMPNYPAGKVFPEYRGRLFSTENADGCTIIRTAYLTTPRNLSKLRQLLSYLSFIPAVFLSGMRAGPADVVLVTSPPPFPILPAILIAAIRRAKLVMDVRDLWSDELVTYGGMKESGIAVWLVRRLERWGYRWASLITPTTQSLIDTVVERGAERTKMFLVPNGADLVLFKPMPPDNPTAREYPFRDRFVLMYSGLFGIKHGLEVLLEAARILRDNKKIVFFLLGDGARRKALEKYIETENLENVIIAGGRAVKDVPAIIARADVCFAAVSPEVYSKKLISVKLFEYLACEKPVIGAVAGESARVLEESGGGVVVPPGDADGIVNAILDLYNDPNKCEAMGKAGRRYVEEKFSRRDWAARLELRIATFGVGSPPGAEATMDGEVPSSSPSPVQGFR